MPIDLHLDWVDLPRPSFYMRREEISKFQILGMKITYSGIKSNSKQKKFSRVFRSDSRLKSLWSKFLLGDFKSISAIFGFYSSFITKYFRIFGKKAKNLALFPKIISVV